jgi:hypothetical protein
MTDKTLTTQQEKAGINIIAGRACNHGSSLMRASSLTLKARAVHILEEPPEMTLTTTRKI